MTVYRNKDAHDASNVEFLDDRIVRYDKRNRTAGMKYIDYGLGLFQRKVFEDLPENVAVDLAAVYSELVQRGEVAGVVMEERFYEIGSISGLRETKIILRDTLSNDAVK